MATAATAIGATAMTVQNAAGFTAGEQIVVGQGADQEIATIAGVAGNTLNFAAGLANAHSIGEAVGGNASTVNSFINSFNAGHYGVTARSTRPRSSSSSPAIRRTSTSSTGRLQGANPATPGFTITDSNQAGAVPQPSVGTAATSLLDGAGRKQHQQRPAKRDQRLGRDGGERGQRAALALQQQLRRAGAADDLGRLVQCGRRVRSRLTGATLSTFSTINVGDVLTIDAGDAPIKKTSP